MEEILREGFSTNIKSLTGHGMRSIFIAPVSA